MLDSTHERLPTLTTERLRLRWLDENDVPALYALFSHPEVARYWSEPFYTDVSQATDLLARVHTHFAERTLFQWGVARTEDDQVVGTATLAHLDTQNRRAELGFALNRDHWGTGVMSEAVGELIRFAFEDLELHRLEADVDPRNESSLKLVERVGFVREGYLRERWIVAGEINDTALYGLLAKEWRENTGRG